MPILPARRIGILFTPMAFSRPRRPDDAAPERAPRPLAPGTVTRLTAQEKNADRVSVYLDGAFAFGVHQDLVLEYGLHRGRVLDVDEQQAIADADARLGARSTALAYLSYRARSRREVAGKLAERGTPGAVAEETLAWLEERGYLDDAAYAEQYAQSRSRAHGYGPERVRMELLRRGVDRETAEAAVRGAFEAEETLETARTHAHKRWPALLREPDARKRRRKLFDFLVRRGFSFDVAGRVVAEVVEGGDDPEGDDGA